VEERITGLGVTGWKEAVAAAAQNVVGKPTHAPRRNAADAQRPSTHLLECLQLCPPVGVVHCSQHLGSPGFDRGGQCRGDAPKAEWRAGGAGVGFVAPLCILLASLRPAGWAKSQVAEEDAGCRVRLLDRQQSCAAAPPGTT
jgi:hypothetical protein